jgi:hypothetical protein
MPTGVMETEGDQVMHALLAHVAEHYQRAGIVLWDPSLLNVGSVPLSYQSIIVLRMREHGVQHLIGF